MNLWTEFRKNLSAILLVCLLVGLLVVFVVVMRSENPRWIFDLLGLSRIGGPETVAGNSKYEVLKFIGISMGGVLVALQAVIANKRANAMDKTAQAQADAAQAQADAAKAQARATLEQAGANRLTEQGQRQERLKNAIEHLGNPSESVRLGGAYELFHLAIDIETLRRMVLDILCAHIRWTTGEDEYREIHKSKPSEEVQSLLTLLFIREHGVFKHFSINLEGSWLNGANLQYARLQGAALTNAYLQGAFLHGVQLQEAFLIRAQLQGADLTKAYLQGAFLHKAQLQGTFLDDIYLQGASLPLAQLQGSLLSNAQLQEAFLGEAQLQGAFLIGAKLQGAFLVRAQLQGADLTKAHFQGARINKAQLQGAESVVFDDVYFEGCIRKRTNRESNLSEVIFAGGLSQEDVDGLIKDLPDEKANKLREKLRPHIGRPESNELPKNSGAITGAYTEEDAKKWIAEYEEAMSEVSRATAF